MTGSRLGLLISISALIWSWSAIMFGTTLCVKILSGLLVIIRSMSVADVGVTLVGVLII